MARPLRLEYEGAVYHLTARGNAGQAIFLDDDDRLRFLDVLSDVVDRFGWICHAYCLMTNHYHLLVETPAANLSRGMRQLNGVYTQAFNRRHGWVGHVLGGRFKSIVVEKESYLLELARYVVLNPVSAKLVRHPRRWRWSSYRATAGQASPPDFLTVDWILAQFGDHRKRAQAAYRRFVLEGQGLTVWDGLRGGMLLGGEQFVEELRPLLQDRARAEAIPKAERLVGRPPLEALLKGIRGDRKERNKKIHEAVRARLHLEPGWGGRGAALLDGQPDCEEGGARQSNIKIQALTSQMFSYPFLEAVEKKLERYDSDGLQAILLEMAEGVSVSNREGFLASLKPPEAATVEATYEDPTLHSEIEAFVKDIENGTYVDGWGWDSEIREEGASEVSDLYF